MSAPCIGGGILAPPLLLLLPTHGHPGDRDSARQAPPHTHILYSTVHTHHFLLIQIRINFQIRISLQDPDPTVGVYNCSQKVFENHETLGPKNVVFTDVGIFQDLLKAVFCKDSS